MDGTDVVNQRSTRQWRHYTPATPTHTQITDMPTSTRGTSKHRLLFVLLTGAGLMAGCNQRQHTDLQADAATAGAESAEASSTEATETDDPYAAEGERRAQAVAAQLIGTPGPTAVLTTLDGDKIDLASLQGRMPVYLKYWATWCGPCREQMPGFETIYQAKGDEMQVVAINTGFTDTEDQVRKYREALKLSMPVAIDDGTLAAVLDLRVTPQHVLIDRNGLIAYVGHKDGPELDRAIEQVLSRDGDEPAIAQADQPATAPVIAEGDLVGDFTVTLMSGDPMPLGGADAPRPRAVLFFSPWCESYLAETRPAISAQCKRYREAVEKLAETGEVDWVALSNPLWASAQDVHDYREATGTQVPLALDPDGAIFRAFGVRQVPSVAVIDRRGTLIELLSAEDSDIAAAVAIAP